MQTPIRALLTHIQLAIYKDSLTLNIELAGLAVIAFGLWLRFGGAMADFATDKKSPEYFFMGLYVLVGAGAIMSAVGFFGCCGAARESQCLLGALHLTRNDTSVQTLPTSFVSLWGVALGKDQGLKDKAVQEAQKIYEDAYDDYMKNPVGKVNSTIYRYHVANCLVEIQNVINSKLHLVGIVGIAIAGVTIFGMIFSMVLCCAIRNTRDMI
ncbi:Tetraspanin-2 [Willisornis vidua]|uniref:Tetraspanin-2 n=1 Tax=Willisornis vidua TaxID=1566151 RepID=A0ABQ9CY02_9PASS|nr:Tetraspanin-2 [Willisornis vidua]